MSKNKKQKQGFTLIELLVVISIIGLLSMISVVALGSARAKARDSRRLTDIKAIGTAIDLYILDYDHSPYLGANDCNAFTSIGGDTCTAIDWDADGKWSILETELAEYLSQLPVDPCGMECPGSESTYFAYQYNSPANLASWCDGVGDCNVTDRQFDSWYLIYAKGMESAEDLASSGFATSF